MNCKPGDLAKIVNSTKHAGRLVVVHHLIVDDERLPTGRTAHPSAVGSWLCEFIGGPVSGPVVGGRDVLGWWPIHDRFLRPIRDNDGEDEMLRIAGKPEKVNA